jgi:glycylpeptide N-tetradecanoyltransferase
VNRCQVDNGPGTGRLSCSEIGKGVNQFNSSSRKVPSAADRKEVVFGIFAMKTAGAEFHEDHWRNHWNFHQGNQRKQRSSHEIVLKESMIQTRCEEAQVIISSPNEENLDEYFEQVIVLLTENYVEDEEGVFRFVYKPEHLRWLMLPNTSHLDLFIGLREADSGKLIGFLAACPITLHVRDNGIDNNCFSESGGDQGETTESLRYQEAALVDFVCVHQSRRGERLCPLLYDILDARLQTKGIHALVKTSGTLLDYPVSEINYYHLILNHDRCEIATFSSPRPAHHKIQTLSSDFADSFLPLEERHLESAYELFSREAQKYSLGLLLPTLHHTKHFLMERKDIVLTLVRQDPDSPNHITDLVTIFFVPHQILPAENPLQGEVLKIGYLSYHIATTITELELLKVAATIGRDRYELDCLNILPIGQITPATCREARAGRGTGMLYYYINCGVGVDRPLKSSDLFIFPGV